MSSVNDNICKWMDTRTSSKVSSIFEAIVKEGAPAWKELLRTAASRASFEDLVQEYWFIYNEVNDYYNHLESYMCTPGLTAYVHSFDYEKYGPDKQPVIKLHKQILDIIGPVYAERCKAEQAKEDAAKAASAAAFRPTLGR